MIDVNQVGAAFNASTNTSSFYLHTQLAGGFGDASKLVGAAQSAATAEEPLVRGLAGAAPGSPGRGHARAQLRDGLAWCAALATSGQNGHAAAPTPAVFRSKPRRPRPPTRASRPRLS